MERINNLIYFNNNRTTPLDETVLESMLPYAGKSIQEDLAAFENAKLPLAQLLNAKPMEVLFTSGTTESIFLAMKSIFAFYQKKGKHIITNVSEHFAVINCCKELEKEGAEITYLKVNREGLIDVEELKNAIQANTILVSIMAANNETGVIQPIEKISEICNEREILFFSDASQYVGKLRCDVKDLGISCLTFGAHKMYGPKGIGLLYIDEKHEGLSHEIQKNYKKELQLDQVIGFAKAAELSQQNYWDVSAHVSKLRAYFEHQILDIEGLCINGSTRHRLYNTSNISFPNRDQLIKLQSQFEFADNLQKPSYVLESMGLNAEEVKNTFRFSFGKQNTLDEVKLLSEEVLRAFQS